MGRLPALALTIFVACACEADAKNAPSAPRERSQAIADLAPAAPASTPAAAPPSASAAAKPKEPRILCGGHSSGPGKLFPKKPVGRAAAPGAPELAENVAVGGGKWTWVNFWAAWCAPCKEEIPRLQRFEQQLTRAGTAFRLAFITLDDDPRQLDKFLTAQSPEGLRTSYWLREGKERDEWLQAAGMEPDPALPIHLLVDPQGKVRCTVKGAIEDGDYSQIAALVSK